MSAPNPLSRAQRCRRARQANRDSMGRIANYALDLRLQAEERQAVIEALGWEPEGLGDPYAATTGEMYAYLRLDSTKGEDAAGGAA